MKNNSMTIGDHGFYIVPELDTISPCTILAVPSVNMFQIHDDELLGTRFMPSSEVFHLEEDAKSELYKRHHKKLMDYMSEITDINSLIRFAYTHPICGDECDPQARLAYQLRAEAFGVKFD